MSAPELSLARLRALEAEGWLRSQRHPTLPLSIWNYTDRAQVERHWTPETRACRGLVLTDDGRVVARPLEKFFNWNEPDVTLPDEPIGVFEKLDGSLIIVAHDSCLQETIVASRGSFTSEQVAWARELLEEEHGESGPDAMWLEPDVTYCLELIHPANRIVVDYGEIRELVLVAARWTATGAEIPLEELDWLPFNQPRRFPPDAIQELAAREEPNSEGYVVRFAGGTRVKVKLADYLRLHRLMTGVTERTVWALLRDGQPLDPLLEGLPDEFHAWVLRTRAGLLRDYHDLLARGYGAVAAARAYRARRAQAELITGSYRDVAAVAFRLLDGKTADDIIWRRIEPPAWRPLWNREDDDAA